MEVKEALKGFRYKKGLGQNFITDANLLDAIVADAGVTSEDTVVEIGVGAGTLTGALAAKAARVIGFEVDAELKPILQKTLPKDGVTVHFKDVLKLSDQELSAMIGGPFKVVANLPYYITTPVLMRFLESELPVQSMTVMVQKEVADRLCAAAGESEYGAITLQVQLRGQAVQTRMVSRRLFYPVPNVDSAVVRVDLSPACDPVRMARVSRLIKAGFAMRRKTLVNNLMNAYQLPREQASAAIVGAGLPADVRGEKLTLENYMALDVSLEETKKHNG